MVPNADLSGLSSLLTGSPKLPQSVSMAVQAGASACTISLIYLITVQMREIYMT